MCAHGLVITAAMCMCFCNFQRQTRPLLLARNVILLLFFEWNFTFIVDAVDIVWVTFLEENLLRRPRRHKSMCKWRKKKTKTIATFHACMRRVVAEYSPIDLAGADRQQLRFTSKCIDIDSHTVFHTLCDNRRQTAAVYIMASPSVSASSQFSPHE